MESSRSWPVHRYHGGVSTGWLTYDDFAAHVGDRYQLILDDSALSLELLDATASGERGGPGPNGEERLQFALLFRGPPAPALPQATRTLTHPGLGELELFLVPIGPDADGMRYEAVFA
jgi:hypothetical protein